MKKSLFILLLFFCTVSVPAQACVNLDINVGAVDSVQGRIYAAIIATFIHERTGTKSIIKFYANTEEMHGAIADKKVELIVANIAEALQFAGLPFGREAEADFQAAKQMYKKEMQLVLLAPLGLITDDAQSDALTSPALDPVVLEKFPALPRLLKKLAGKVDDQVTAKLLDSVRSEGKKPGRVAKDFLVANRLI